jgi:hypothetical protein
MALLEAVRNTVSTITKFPIHEDDEEIIKIKRLVAKEPPNSKTLKKALEYVNNAAQDYEIGTTESFNILRGALGKQGGYKKKRRTRRRRTTLISRTLRLLRG